MSHDKPLALTMGDPAGIGGDITLQVWAEHRDTVPPFFVLDDPQRLTALAARLGLTVPLHEIADPAEASRVFDQALPVLPVKLNVSSVAGQPDAANAGAVIASIERAVASVRSGDAAAVVTNPIAKAVLHASGFGFPGHTEFLGSLADDAAALPVMMLASPLLRVVPVTIHVSLRDAIAQLTTESIVETGRIVARALAADFGIAAPRLAVAGLNPHAGEGGAMGAEDETVVRPAVEALRADGIHVDGPLPPDTMFHAQARSRYDAALCMYHDQALIPIKTLDFAGAVNVTLGLPFVRTSPDHGTAFGIAGTGQADPSSLLAALRLAAEMAANRAAGGER